MRLGREVFGEDSLARPKRSGHKFHGRAIYITHPDGKTEAHILPVSALHRDLSKAEVSFDQWDKDGFCGGWRARILKTLKNYQPIRAARLSYLSLIHI